MMNTTTKTFRATTALAMLAVLALPFWQVASKAQADGGGTEPYFVQADQERMDRGITGYMVTPYANGDMQIDVMSETRSAVIDCDVDPTVGEAEVMVTVGASGETLTMTATSAWAGTATINGTEVATWQHDHNETWQLNNFNRLQTFTSWNILGDVLSDVNLKDDLPPDALALVGLLTLIVGVFILGASLGGTAVYLWVSSEMSCSARMSACEDSGYDPEDFDCEYVMDNCPQTDMIDGFCEEALSDCMNGDLEACDLYDQFCGNQNP